MDARLEATSFDVRVFGEIRGRRAGDAVKRRKEGKGVND